MNKNKLHILLIMFAFIVGACSVERKNPLSKAYHNTTARYNGYFLAKEKMQLIEQGIEDQMQYDYNQVLPIYPTLDSSIAKGYKADLEDVLKKASFPIQYHKNSKWVDNSYILVGKANYYQMEFGEAMRSFKYVNATSKNSDDRHEALVWLMRTFLKIGELDNAQQVSEYLRKEKLNRDNARELYLTRAQYHHLLQDTAAIIENLDLSLPNFRDKDRQSRIRFTLAQLYQQTGEHKKAYKQYAKVLRNNPPYDLGFFSRLNLGQVSELSDPRDKERIVSHYEKLLKDDKNKEYKDKIYYEMAAFELRQQNYDKTLSLLEKSLRTPGVLQNQKAYSYRLAGETYFDKLNKYSLAAAYYDSAAIAYPQGAPEYEAVIERRDVLADFAQQYATIQKQDSLQRIARMSESERNVYLQQLALRQEEERQREILRQQQQNAQSQDATGNTRSANRQANNFGNSNVGGVWYFDNPVAMASARAEFVRRWGDRPLQDFWRTRSRGETGNEAQVSRAPVEAPENQMTADERTQLLIQTYKKELPLTKAAMARSEKEVEDAYFKMANIYSQYLQSPEKAIQAFEELLKRFPNTEHAADSYYSLYLLYGKTDNKAQQQAYYTKIKQQFSNTIYARLVDDSDFKSKNAADNLKARQLYDKAFEQYKQQDYASATKLVNTLLSQYPLNDIQDKIAYLDVLIAARTQKPEALRTKLQRFVSNYPKSNLMAQAQELLETYNELEQKNQLRQTAPLVHAPSKPKLTNNSEALEKKLSTEVASLTASTQVITEPVPSIPVTKKQVKTEPVVPKQEEEIKESSVVKVEQKPEQAPKPQQQVKVVEANIKQSNAAETTTTVNTPVEEAVTPALPTAPPVDPLLYKSEEDSAYYFVLIYPSKSPAFKDIKAKFEKYNNTYYQKQNLNVENVVFTGNKAMLVMKAFEDPKLAQSFNIKQKAPQSPIGSIRGIEFTTFVISSANYTKFLEKKDLDAYLTFFQNNF